MKLKYFIFFTLFYYVGVFGNRVKRHLVFNKGSKLFFAVDVRDNLFDYYKFFANAFGIKMDWDLPHSTIPDSSVKRVQRRDVHMGIEYFLNQHNFNGTLCVDKFICEAMIYLPQSDNFLAQLYEIIFAPTEVAGAKTEESCRKLLHSDWSIECPLTITTIAHMRPEDFVLTTDSSANIV